MPAQRQLPGSFWHGIFRFGLILIVIGSGIVQPIAASAAPAEDDDDPIRGIPGLGSTGITETSAQIAARQSVADTLPIPPPPPEVDDEVDFSNKVNNPASLRLRQGPGAVSPVGPLAVQAGPVPQTIGVSADGPDSTVNTCGTPPDTMGAVGPTQFVVTINCNFVSYNKTTGLADGFLNATPLVFFDSVRNGFSVSDPHVRYDPTSGRWFIVMISVTIPNRILLAVSSEANITAASSWAFFSFENSLAGHPTTCLADYPTPGIDANAIYIGVNQFCGATIGSASFLSSDGYVVQKSSMLGAGPIKVTAFPNLFAVAPLATGPYTPQGVDNPDATATEGYFIGVDGTSWGLLQLRRVSNPGGDPAGLNPPTISGNIGITTALQNTPVATPHKGNTAEMLDASDGRLFQAYLRAGSLWTALDSSADLTCSTNPVGALNDRNAVYWYEITSVASGQTPALAQAGSICDTTSLNPAHYTYGSIMANGLKQAVVGFTIAGANNFTTPGFSGRLASDPASTLEGINIINPGAHPYNPSFDTNKNPVRRWGDYSYTSLDPCDDMTLWTIQEYASSDNIYGERFAQLKAPPPAAPTTALPGLVAMGIASLNVGITGVSAAGAAFYDTPASISDPCRTRLHAAATGGVIVNSVTYTDATHLTLNISTVSAAAGPVDVTITNPDGQSILAGGILTVSPGAVTATTTAVTSSLSPSTFTAPVTFTATVTPASGSVVPTGSVTFMDSSTPLATVTLAAGKAGLTTSTLTAGTHTISATYNGDATFSSSQGTLAGGQQVNKATAGVMLDSLSQVYNGSPRPASAVTTPPGLAVSFTYNGSSTVPGSGGVYAVVATVNDANYAGTASGSLMISPAPTTIQLTSSKNPALIGSPITFSVTVSSLGLVPNGQVTVTVDGTPQIVTLTAGSAATSVFNAFASGAHSVTAAYTGNNNFAASGPANLTQTMRMGVFLPMLTN